jgi:hypothetical protein
VSTYLAIATVTAALQQVLQGPVKAAVNHATVGFNRPDAAGATTTSPVVNVYLYQVTPNTAYRNADLPTRRSDGTLGQRAQAALDLHYLLTFHGDDTQLEPQRLLGAVAVALQAQPLLTTKNIQDAATQFTFLAGSGLENQVERVKFTPTALSLEEFSKLWSVFFQVEYALSAAYQASVVLLQADQGPQEALPVKASNLYVTPLRWPGVDRVVSQAGANLPITSSSTLSIQGRQLRGDTTLVLMENQEFTPATITDTEVTLPIPASVHAGLQGLQILQKIEMGTPQTLHRGFESNVSPFVLRPTITGLLAAANPPGTDVTVTVVPKIGTGQRAVLILNDPAAVPPVAYTASPTVSSADSAQIVIHITGVPTGSYMTRIQIDGAESVLTLDSSGNFTGPLVSIP